MKNAVVFCLLLLFSPLFSQDPLRIENGCNFASADNEEEYYTYDASAEAKQIVERIMQMSVLPQNFIIKSADCKNALATTLDRQRYILYNTSFLENFKKEANTKWAAYCVLAHEIGHHLSNHDLETGDASMRKRYELEADKFAGGIMFRLGARLEEAQAGINTFALESASETHPPKRARLEAVASGWKQAEELGDEADNALGSAAPDSKEKKLYEMAVQEKSPGKALSLLDEALTLNESYADAYLERARRRTAWLVADEEAPNPDSGKKKDDEYDAAFSYDDVVDDLNAYIAMRPKDSKALVLRGNALMQIESYDEALDDYNLAIRLDARNAEAYLYRANWYYDKKNDEKKAKAMRDIDKALELNPNYSDALFARGMIRYYDEDYKGAIPDFDKCLSIAPDRADVLEKRAYALYHTRKYANASADFDRLYALAKEDYDEHTSGVCYLMIGKYREAIAEFDRYLKYDLKSEKTFLHRGVAKQAIGQTSEAHKDYLQAFGIVFSYPERGSYYIGYEKEIPKIATQIGCLLTSVGRPEESLEWLNVVLAEYPDYQETLACKNEAKNKTPAKSGAKSSSPGYPLHMIRYAQDLVKAAEDWRGAPAHVHLQVMRSAMLVGAFDRAIKAAEEALKQNPGEGKAEAGLALAYVLNNQYTLAEPIYNKWKGKKLPESDAETANAVFLKDIAELEAAGVSHPDFKKVKALLK